jgi:hypothetical protein
MFSFGKNGNLVRVFNVFVNPVNKHSMPPLRHRYDSSVSQ